MDSTFIEVISRRCSQFLQVMDRRLLVSWISWPVDIDEWLQKTLSNFRYHWKMKIRERKVQSSSLKKNLFLSSLSHVRTFSTRMRRTAVDLLLTRNKSEFLCIREICIWFMFDWICFWFWFDWTLCYHHFDIYVSSYWRSSESDTFIFLWLRLSTMWDQATPVGLIPTKDMHLLIITHLWYNII